MKVNIKAKDFNDKATLEKTLSTKLKKPVMALKKKSVEKLPFCYEADYFSEGKGFMSIGVAKEILKLFKTGRSKGQGKDENGKAVKVDKKKVAYGVVSVDDDGQFVFNVKGGIMKKAQAKKVIKSIGILKKGIGDNFIITKGEAVSDEGQDKKEDDKGKGGKEDAKEQDKEMKKLFVKVRDRLAKTQKEVLPRIKTQTSTEEDMDFLDRLLQKIKAFLTTYKDCPKSLQTKYADAYEKFKGQKDSIAKLAKRAREIFKLPERVKGNKEEAGKEATKIINRMQEIRKRMVEIRAELAKS